MQHMLLARALTATAALGAALVLFAVPVGSAPANQAPGVTVEWLGWSVFRFTSPTGKVVLTTPFVQNPDSPLGVEDIQQADLILVPNGHQDEVGSTVEIAQRTGARVLASGAGLSNWLVEQGVPRPQLLAGFAQPGSRIVYEGITVRLVENVHGSELPRPSSTVPYGGAAAGFFITFENGFTVYFAGSTPVMAEQAFWAELYQPDMAILHMGADHDPADIAMQVRLLQTGNTNLATVWPHHNRVAPAAGATTVADVQAAINLIAPGGVQMSAPELGQPYTFEK